MQVSASDIKVDASDGATGRVERGLLTSLLLPSVTCFCPGIIVACLGKAVFTYPLHVHLLTHSLALHSIQHLSPD